MEIITLSIHLVSMTLLNTPYGENYDFKSRRP